MLNSNVMKNMLLKNLAGTRGQVALTGLLLPVGMGLLFVLHALIARKLQVQDFGEFSFVLQVSSILAIFASAGLPVSSQKFIPMYREQEKFGILSAFFSWSFIWIMFVSVILVSVVFVLEDRFKQNLTLIAMTTVPLLYWLWQRYTALGHGEVFLALLPRDVVFPILAILAFYFIDITSSAETIYWYNGLLGLCLLVGMAILFARNKISKRDLIANRGLIKTWHKAAAPMSLTAITQLGFNGFDIVLLGLLSTMQETGLYSSALRISLLIGVIIRVLNIALGHRFSALHASQNIAAIKSLYLKSTMLTALVGVLLFITLAVFSTQFMSIFGSSYVAGANILVILCIGQLAGCLVGPVGIVHNMIGNEFFAARSQVMWLFLALIANLIIIPRFGASGAAIVTASAMIMMKLHQALYLYSGLTNALESVHTSPKSVEKD